VNLPASVPEVTGVGGTEFTEGVVSYWSSSNGAYGGSALSYIPEIGWNDSGSGGLASSGGGMSIFFARPAWQSAPGVQSLNVRFVPDLSLTASADHDGYNVFIAGSATIVGGTSASTPVFAGMILLMNQYLGVNGVGNINPNLYRLASSTTNVFHDITSGTNIVPCVAGSNGCQSNGTLGYAAGPGYDMVTGLSTRST
jgi:subtilase family serine protease